ncbi:MAG: hypothetical protein K2K67_01170 [Treponemataceae bacterium]|nr:hypothetical protein [Treponemataceae bacterium]
MKQITILSLMLAALFCSAATAQEQEQDPQKPVAVVVPFDSSGVPQEEVDVVYRMFLSEFVRTGKCIVVDRSKFDKIKAQQNFQLSDWSNNDKVAKLGKALNANVVVTGQIMKFRTSFMFITQILDVNSTEIISSADEQVSDVAVLFGKFGDMCRTLTKNLAKPKKAASGGYDIGDKGPGGGWIFYVSEAGFPVYNGNERIICHYLECAPTDLGGISWCPCPSNKDKKPNRREYCNVATIDGVGAGRENTINIIKKVHPGGSGNASNCAAYACFKYFTGTSKVGDWYLPSKMELDLIYKNLVKQGIINTTALHWSSSQGDGIAWGQRFSDGYQYGYYEGYGGKSNNYCVRAVRAF